MSEQTIGYLQGEVTRLNSEVGRLNKEAKDRRISGGKAKKLAEDLEKQVADLTRDRDEWKGKATAAPGELQATVDRLTGQLRERDHGDAWKAAVGDQLADKVGVRKLWQELQYTPGESVPTPEQIAEQLGKAREAAPYLFRPAAEPAAADPGGSQQPPARPPLGAAPAGGRGDRDTAASKVLRVKAADLRNPAIALSPAFKAQQADALKQGMTVEYVD